MNPRYVSAGWRIPAGSRGTSLLEVLMTIIIMSFGLLGLAALQAKAYTAEFESYQRGQALILLADMVSRMENNTADIAGYKTTDPLGTGATDSADCTSLTTRASIDKCEWSKAVKGASEKTSGGSNQGAMIDARGCIQETTAGTEYLVSVVWQGQSATSAPATTCGSGLYDADNTRRAVTTVVRVADLAAS
ncbi:MAG TPA: type IV pilus modification protein PilV [Paucimonas sp.]|nr:type IV pilus modification protein PilV [Paucimonas sp.]